MIRPDDLDAAVHEGIVTDTQAAALRDLAAKRENERTAVPADEEPFRFARGFADVFLAVGIVLLSSGLMFFVPPASVAANLITAVVMWGLAELLVRHMRLVLPGILLALLFAFFIFRALPAADLLALFRGVPTIRVGIVPFLGTATLAELALKGVAAAGASALFYARFRFPFALLLVAGSLVIAVETLTALFTGIDGTLHALIRLTTGLVVFAAAMSFDLSDRARVTRRAECAFWLHLLAAPLIVRSLISMAATDMSTMNNAVAATVLGIVLVLTFVAVLIDRRALLVSALLYLGFVIAHALGSTTTDRAAVVYSTLVILGVLVLALGVGWLSLRRLLLSLLPPRMAARLPIAVPAA
jgi:hypothetical protein